MQGDFTDALKVVPVIFNLHIFDPHRNVLVSVSDTVQKLVRGMPIHEV